MTTLLERYEQARTAAFGNPTSAVNSVMPFVKDLAKEIDDISRRLARIDGAPDVKPHDARPGMTTWQDAFGALNGSGDFLNRIRDMAGAVDRIVAWLNEPPADIVEQFDGTSPAMSNGSVALVESPLEHVNDVDIVESEEPPQATVCPKCGKPLKARGAHLHINRCKGNS